jgi:hypothetical protein
MNERIRELAVKSGMSQMNRRSDGFYVVSEKTFDLFAELIVRECAELADNQEDYLTAKIIKKHFGVEE